MHMYMLYEYFSNDRSIALLQKFVELQTQYAMLQHKTSATGLAKEMLGKVKQLKDAEWEKSTCKPHRQQCT